MRAGIEGPWVGQGIAIGTREGRGIGKGDGFAS